MTASRSAAADAMTKPDASAIPTTLRRIVLVGFMGAGKTTAGRLLAERLGWDFLDLDAHIEARAGATVPEIFARDGEARFRRLESTALANALSRQQTVLALGGGAPEALTNQLLLEQTPGTLVIYLEASFATLFDRCMLQSFASPDHIRPVMTTPEEAEARFNQRHPIYRRMARLTIATEDLGQAEVADSILAGILTH